MTRTYWTKGGAGVAATALCMLLTTTATAQPLTDAFPAGPRIDTQARQSVGSHSAETPTEALKTLATAFPAAIGTPVFWAAKRAAAARLSFLGDYAMRIDRPGADDSLAISTGIPLRSRNDAGRKAPVDLRLTSTRTGFEPNNPLTSVWFPARLKDGISLGSSGLRLISGADGVDAVARRVGDRVFYGNMAADTDAIVNAVPRGFEWSLQIRSPDAPTVHPARFALPADSHLRLLPSGDAAEVVRGGKRLALIEPAWAVDANGRAVEVAYEVRDDTLLLNVRHRSHKTAYPVYVDPVIDDYSGSNGWHNNPAASFVPWVCPPGQSAPFVCPNAGAYGSGLYVQAPPAAYQVNAYTRWVYDTPGGDDSYISQIDFIDWLASLQGQSSAQTGIYFSSSIRDRRDNSIVAKPPTGTTFPVDTYFNYTLSTSATNGNRISWGLVSLAANTTTVTVTDYLGGAIVYLNDRAAPTVSNVTHGQDNASWYAAGTNLTSNVTGSSTGLGVKSLRVQGPGVNQTKTAPCDGTHTGGYCQAAFTQPFTYSSNSLNEGSNSMSATASSPSGSTSSANTWTVKVDKSQPSASESGDGWSPGGTLGPGQHSVTVSANDSHSGVSRLDFRIDPAIGQDSVQTSMNPSCTASGCSSSYSHTFTFDTGNYPPGAYTITVTATDAANPAGNATSHSENVVFASGTVSPGDDECTSGTVADGWHGDTYGRLQAQQIDSDEVRVCYQIANGTSINQAGAITIGGGGSGVGQPSIDENSGACASTQPNAVPGQHPLFTNTTAGVVQMIDAYASASEAWVCLQVGDVKRRVVIPVSAGVTPPVDISQNAPPPTPPTPWPAGPSASCVTGGQPALINSQYGPVHMWLATHQPNATTTQLCVRQEGAGVGLGGTLSVSAAGGALPVERSPDTSPCTFEINHLQAQGVDVTLSMTPPTGPGSSPPSICVESPTASVSERFTITGGLPVWVSWTPDPGTPGGPIPG